MTQHRGAALHFRSFALALACAAIGAAPGAMADDDGYVRRGDAMTRDTGYVRTSRDHEDGHGHHGHDHDRARRLLERGDIQPLSDILARVRDDLPGRIIATELEREDGAYVYEFKVVDSAGRVREVYVDAATARVLKVEDDD
ncbi:PepSY domain-containing protein [Rhodospira trueperi]|uniref:Peptidase propeptide and YPEB domain-containing protein n=1 Tax=Rhodospira trueperi TaxID=69960 RepID=A0A1G7FES3_9PROT|nr:PepSY domain-containing protein [Rhodospira trueperi]SDE74370.1 Peptidase propeptide and YPEB domain-containing protein [Rhodospira trueperi]